MNSLLRKFFKSERLLRNVFQLFNYLEIEKIKRDTAKTISKFGTFGIGSRINGKITVKWPWGVVIGNNVHIGDNSFLDARGGIMIGDNTHISRNLTLYTTNHHYRGSRLPYSQKLQAKEVVIGKNVWIGMNVNITPGIHIGDGAIISMGTVVSKNVQPGEIVGSNKQVTIGMRSNEAYQEKENASEYGEIAGAAIESEKVRNFLVTPFEVEKVVFILSTGRAGSTSIAKLLNQYNTLSAFHETFYTLLKRLSLEYITGRIGKEDAKKKLEFYFGKIGFIKPGTLYVESDQKLAPFVGFLEELFDKPKFIWLIRHPKTFMHSAVSRGWFDEGDIPQFFNNKVLIDTHYSSHCTRITGYLTGEYTRDEWKDLDKRMRALWYWKYWNSLIQKELELIPEDRKLFLQLEKLNRQKDELLNFIGVPDRAVASVPRSNRVRKKDSKTYQKTKEENYKFFDNKGMKTIAKEMDLFGYIPEDIKL